MNAALRRKLLKVRLLSLDLDGVLTDGGLYYTAQGDEMRKFNVRDGAGIKLAQAAGFEIAILTASDIPAIAHRGRKLGIAHVFTGVHDKLGAMTELAARLRLDFTEIAHIADDVNDLALLRAVGAPMAVADAMASVKRQAIYVTKKPGGGGAVREVCELLMGLQPKKVRAGDRPISG
jgi:3-deoxy-D-manno-octulosonate 8-phosphate phosphatase (KDO 8-P phosphatase)